MSNKQNMHTFSLEESKSGLNTDKYTDKSTDKSLAYNTIFSLVEEELYQRLNPSGYKDSIYDGTKYSICGSSNLDMSDFDKFDKFDKFDALDATKGNHINIAGGGNKNRTDKLIPGKFDVIRYSHNLPLNVAIKGTLERQKLFIREH